MSDAPKRPPLRDLDDALKLIRREVRGCAESAEANRERASVARTPEIEESLLREEWLVAYADPDSDTLAWSGWPDGRARLSDCDVIRRCSDTDHAAAVERWRNVRDDSRRDAVLRRYEGCTNA